MILCCLHDQAVCGMLGLVLQKLSHYLSSILAVGGASFGPADSVGVTLKTGGMRFHVFMGFTNKVHAVRITQPSTTSTVLNMI